MREYFRELAANQDQVVMGNKSANDKACARRIRIVRSNGHEVSPRARAINNSQDSIILKNGSALRSNMIAYTIQQHPSTENTGE